MFLKKPENPAPLTVTCFTLFFLSLSLIGCGSNGPKWYADDSLKTTDKSEQVVIGNYDTTYQWRIETIDGKPFSCEKGCNIILSPGSHIFETAKNYTTHVELRPRFVRVGQKVRDGTVIREGMYTEKVPVKNTLNDSKTIYIPAGKYQYNFIKSLIKDYQDYISPATDKVSPENLVYVENLCRNGRVNRFKVKKVNNEFTHADGFYVYEGEITLNVEKVEWGKRANSIVDKFEKTVFLDAGFYSLCDVLKMK